MKDKLFAILEELRPDVTFEGCSTLIDDGILDSFDVINLVGELNDSFEIEISVEDILPENFNSTERILQLIQRLQAE